MAKNYDDVELWKDRIRDGQRYAIHQGGLNDWRRYKNYYRHRFASKDQVVPVNVMFSVLRSMIPQVFFRNPKVSITARKPGLQAELNARIVQKIDNWLLKELDCKNEFKRMAEEAFFTGLGTGFFGYDSEYGFSEKLAGQDGMMTLSQFDKSGNRIEFNSSINPGMPWFLHARTDDVVFPYGATDQNSLEWVALRVFRRVRDIKADRKYTNPKGLNGTHVPVRSYPEGGFQQQDYNAQQAVDPEDMWIELWQVHSRRDGKIKALALEYDKFLRNEPDELQMEHLPLETLCFNQDPEFIYGVPDARIIEPQMLELTDIRTQAMKHRRQDNLKAIASKGVLSDEAKIALTDGTIGPIVETETDALDLNKVIAKLNPGVSGILQDLIAQGEVARGDIREVVGFSRVASGEYQGKTHVSAEETQRVFQSLNVRLDERRDAMADLVARVVRKFNQIIFERWTSNRVAQVVGPDGAQWWLKFTGPQIRDEYDLNVVAEEGPPMDSETKKKLALQAAEVWAKLNAGAIKSGQPVPGEIQRLIFSQFQETGLDIDRLLAQTQAGAQSMQAQMGGAGASPDRAISPALLAQLSRGAR